MTTKALVIIGSRTKEDKHGIVSGNRVATALRQAGWIVEILHSRDGQRLLALLLNARPDVVVPVGFGAPCEDGHIFAVARMVNIPCAGPTPAVGSLLLDKATLSRVVDSIFAPDCGVRSPKGIVLSRGVKREIAEELTMPLQPPLVVKPNFSGSSVGLLVTHSQADAVDHALALLDDEGKVLIQQLEHPVSHEISCTVLDGPDGPEFLPIVELRRDDVLVMSAEEKFGDNGFDRHILPARLTAPTEQAVRKAVIALHAAVGAVGLTRTDLLVLANGELVVLEMNAIPGLLESSIACDAARFAGIEFPELAMRYAQSAFLSRPEPAVWS